MKRRWIRVERRAAHKPPDAEKQIITAACEKFIAETLKPRFLPATRSTEFNYPIDIYGKWHGGKYRLIERFRYNPPDPIEPEFDAPFARLEYVGRDCFDLSYHRHTGEWWRLYRSLSLEEALRTVESDELLHPV